jgi:caffeoyl-CoA O-methyltransferase
MKPLVDESLEKYAEAHTDPPDPLLDELRAETFASVADPQMQVGRVEGTFLRMLVGLSRAKRALEIGMYTGYSGLMIAAALPEDGELVTCDVNPKVEEVARRYFARSAHGRKITIRMGPALDTIATLSPPFDFVFLDADKENYPRYYEAVLPLLASGGLLVADNVLWSGRVVDPARTEPDTSALRAFDTAALADPRFEATILPVGDGLLVAGYRG